MQEQILKIHINDKNSLATVRCFPNLQVAEEGDWIWLRGISSNEKLDIQLQQLPTRFSFFLDEKERLFPLKKLTPIGQLPQLNWQSLSFFFTVEMPIAALPAQIKTTHSVQLKQSEIEQQNVALLTDITTWKNYANSASKIRLNCLKFAASKQGRVLIWGEPLPPIPGQTFWWKDHIFLPSGFDFSLPMLSVLLAKKMNLKNQSVLLFHKNNTWQRIDLENFAKANRSAIRLLK